MDFPYTIKAGGARSGRVVLGAREVFFDNKLPDEFADPLAHAAAARYMEDATLAGVITVTAVATE